MEKKGFLVKNGKPDKPYKTNITKPLNPWSSREFSVFTPATLTVEIFILDKHI
jgi:hypothetical protein